jgi:hypothetical protein
VSFFLSLSGLVLLTWAGVALLAEAEDRRITEAELAEAEFH